MRFTEHMQRLIAAREAGHASRSIFQFNPKLRARFLAQGLGVEVPDFLMNPFVLDQPPPSPSMSVVVKPNEGCSGRGVLPLERDKTGRFRLLFDDVRQPSSCFDAAPWEEWIRQLQEIEDGFSDSSSRISGPYLVEELVFGPVQGQPLATAWKIYCIHGEPIWARQLVGTSRRGGKVRCWKIRAKWTKSMDVPGEAIAEEEHLRLAFEPLQRDVFVNHHLQELDLELPDPGPAIGLIYGYARTVAMDLLERTESPFVRVDLLEGPGGRVVFGEITPHPSGGNDVYHEGWDRELGRIWSRGPAS